MRRCGMATEYRVYDPQKNGFLLTRNTKAEAVGDADSLAALDHFKGTMEVHEVTDGNLVTARRVYETPAN